MAAWDAGNVLMTSSLRRFLPDAWYFLWQLRKLVFLTTWLAAQRGEKRAWTLFRCKDSSNCLQGYSLVYYVDKDMTYFLTTCTDCSWYMDIMWILCCTIIDSDWTKITDTETYKKCHVLTAAFLTAAFLTAAFLSTFINSVPSKPFISIHPMK